MNNFHFTVLSPPGSKKREVDVGADTLYSVFAAGALSCSVWKRQGIYKDKVYLQNPAFRRYQISRPMQLEAPPPIN